MKAFKVVLTQLLISITACVSAQETTDIYYDYILCPSGEIVNGIDTVYELELIIDSTDLVVFDNLMIVDGTHEKSVKYSKIMPSDHKKIKKEMEKFKINMGEWVFMNQFFVLSKKDDGTELILKSLKEKNKVKHKEKTLPGERRFLTLPDDRPLYSDEKEKVL